MDEVAEAPVAADDGGACSTKAVSETGAHVVTVASGTHATAVSPDVPARKIPSADDGAAHDGAADEEDEEQKHILASNDQRPMPMIFERVSRGRRQVLVVGGRQRFEYAGAEHGFRGERGVAGSEEARAPKARGRERGGRRLHGRDPCDVGGRHAEEIAGSHRRTCTSWTMARARILPRRLPYTAELRRSKRRSLSRSIRIRYVLTSRLGLVMLRRTPRVVASVLPVCVPRAGARLSRRRTLRDVARGHAERVVGPGERERE